MAKIAFTKLGKIKNSDPINCIIGNEEILIQTYLPIEEKLDLIQRIIEQAGNNEEGFYNIVKLEMFYTIEMLKTYTNISFTEKQLSNIPKLYDLIKLNHIWEEISKVLPKDEQQYIWENTCNLAREITNYNRSVLGVLKTMMNDYNISTFNLEEIAKTFQDENNFKLLKQIAPLLE